MWLNGKQVYLGGFETEREAAVAYDIGALACKVREKKRGEVWGRSSARVVSLTPAALSSLFQGPARAKPNFAAAACW